MMNDELNSSFIVHRSAFQGHGLAEATAHLRGLLGAELVAGPGQLGDGMMLGGDATLAPLGDIALQRLQERGVSGVDQLGKRGHAAGISGFGDLGI
jgi:hypothetical protein